MRGTHVRERLKAAVLKALQESPHAMSTKRVAYDAALGMFQSYVSADNARLILKELEAEGVVELAPLSTSRWHRWQLK